MIIGIPRSIFYYLHFDKWFYFFKNLNISFIVSPITNKEIMELGNNYANDEMCLSLKTYLGHIAYLENKCDYILIPRIDNYGISDQTCTNFLSIYDIVKNLFDISIINYNICYTEKETEEKAFINMGVKLKKNKKESKLAFEYACKKEQELQNKRIKDNMEKLNSGKRKILVVSHSYNTYDELIGKTVINCLKKFDCEIIYSDRFDTNITNKLAKFYSKDIYFKYSKELIGSIKLCEEKIDGIIFLSTFPCGLDSLVNELVIRKVKKHYINIIIDDIDSMTGIETRIESFIDILEGQKV